MSRAVNISACETDIAFPANGRALNSACWNAWVSGGTRIVVNNARDTDARATAYRTRLLSGPVRHTATRLNRGLRGETRPRDQEGG